MARPLEITRNGVTKNLKDWCEELNVKYKTVHSRVQNGWSIEKALTTMSATGRGGAERDPRDFYPTPDWLTDAVLPFVFPTFNYGSPLRVLEPAVGEGAVFKRLVSHTKQKYDSSVVSNGFVFDAYDKFAYEGVSYTQQDFLEVSPEPVYDLVITNPPFGLAQEMVEHSRKFLCDRPHARAVMLLRQGFMGAQKRAKWHREWLPLDIYATPRRPVFRKGGSDNCEYAWYSYGLQKPEFSRYWLLKTEK